MDNIDIFVLKKDTVCISRVSYQVINGLHTPCVWNNVMANSYNTQIWMMTKEDPDLVSVVLGCQQTCFYFEKAINSLHGSVCVWVMFQKDGTWDNIYTECMTLNK